MSMDLSRRFRGIQIGDTVTVGEAGPWSRLRVQHAQGHQGCQHKEVIPEILRLDTCPLPQLFPIQ